MNKSVVENIKVICDDESLSLVEKLAKIAADLNDSYGFKIYFCEIIGKRWSFVAGSGDIVNGTHRFKITENCGIISDRELPQDDDTQLIYNMIRGMLTD